MRKYKRKVQSLHRFHEDSRNWVFINHKELSKLGKDRGTWELLQQEEEQKGKVESNSVCAKSNEEIKWVSLQHGEYELQSSWR